MILENVQTNDKNVSVYIIKMWKNILKLNMFM